MKQDRNTCVCLQIANAVKYAHIQLLTERQRKVDNPSAEMPKKGKDKE